MFLSRFCSSSVPHLLRQQDSRPAFYSLCDCSCVLSRSYFLCSSLFQLIYLEDLVTSGKAEEKGRKFQDPGKSQFFVWFLEKLCDIQHISVPFRRDYAAVYRGGIRAKDVERSSSIKLSLGTGDYSA
jgi:hypothetical protein